MATTRWTGDHQPQADSPREAQARRKQYLQELPKYMIREKTASEHQEPDYHGGLGNSKNMQKNTGMEEEPLGTDVRRLQADQLREDQARRELHLSKEPEYTTTRKNAETTRNSGGPKSRGTKLQWLRREETEMQRRETTDNNTINREKTELGGSRTPARSPIT